MDGLPDCLFLQIVNDKITQAVSLFLLVFSFYNFPKEMALSYIDIFVNMDRENFASENTIFYRIKQPYVKN